MSKQNLRDYTHSPWSGKVYEKPQTTDSLTRESQDVLKLNPAISKAMRLESADKFIVAYKAQHGIR